MAGYELIDEGLFTGYLYAHPDPQGQGNLGQDLLDGFFQGFLLLSRNLVSCSHQSGYDIGCLEVQVDPLRLFFQELPELQPEKGNLLVDSLDIRGLLQFNLFRLIQSPAIERPGTTSLLAFSFSCHNGSWVGMNSQGFRHVGYGQPAGRRDFSRTGFCRIAPAP